MDERQRSFCEGRWKVKHEPKFAQDPYPWTVYNTAWEHLDQNTDVAAIEGGQWATWPEAWFAFEECLRLVRSGQF